MTAALRRAGLALAAIATPILTLAACDTGATDASGATASEARQLNDAAAMLDPDSVSVNAVAGNIGGASTPGE